MRGTKGWLGLGALALAGGAALWWQNMTMAPWRTELALLGGREAERRDALAERERLASVPVPAAELERLRADRAAVERLRSEIDDLRAGLKLPPKGPAAEPSRPDRLAARQLVPAAEWKNVGANTPPAALETALWAAAGGDVEAFAALVTFDAPARVVAQALLDGMPAERRAQHGTPERLLAFLSIKDVPLGSAEVREWTPAAEGKVMLASLMLSAPDGARKDVTLPLMRQDQTWKLLVVERTVVKYASSLNRPEPTK